MAARLKAVVPLTISIGVLAFLATELALNFTFHWVTVQNGVFGAYGVPESIQLALPAIFVGWGLYFLTSLSFSKTAIAALTGTIGATLTMAIGPKLADSPDFWGLALMIGITAAALVVLSTAVEDDRFAPAPAFCAYASVFFWWIATGLDNFVPGGKGPHTAEAVTAAITNKPLSAGTGAFGGLLSTPWQWVAITVLASLVLGGVFGIVSVWLAGVLGKIGSHSASEPNVAAPA
jgi:hypothetical protein